MLLACLVAGTLAYLLGSIPFGLLLLRVFRGVDVRTTGSGNIGTANVARVAPGLGLWTLLFDSAKGLAAVIIAREIARLMTDGSIESVAVITGLSALLAIVGHVFPVWLKFKGGKGVATAMGAFLGLMPWAVLITIVLYVAIYAVWHYTSLASITVAALFPLIAGIMMSPAQRPFLLPFLIAASLLIVMKHRENIRRLLSGTENRLDLKRR
ncbi:MAG TPA: glycerol-3-phosphate 1-O-acyltransferase PlsY [Terriglobales bacterium]|jgi:glycerol-3-phosphate acyltransferase PlsY